MKFTGSGTVPVGPSQSTPVPESVAVGIGTTVIGMQDCVGLDWQTFEEVTQRLVVPAVVQVTLTVLVLDVNVPSEGVIVHW